MKLKQQYYPSRKDAQVVWLDNMISKLPAHIAALGLSQAKADALLAACKFLRYVLSQWIGAIRAFSKAATDTEIAVEHGTGSSPIALITFTPPALPTGVVPVPPGALTLIFDFIKDIKDSDGYTDAIGQDLQIIAREDATEHPVPKVKLKLLDGDGQQSVKLTIIRYGHEGVLIESRRNGGAWAELARPAHSPYVDARPLLVAGTAEMREYRLRFVDNDVPNGDWTAILKIAVGV
ncbi:MAG: hypothetical protein WCO56_29225 [Verrucomicrobiota bacterium]